MNDKSLKQYRVMGQTDFLTANERWFAEFPKYSVNRYWAGTINIKRLN